jgi:hypothetical protein
MTPSVGVTAVASADESLPVKQAMQSGRETMAPWQARILRAYIAAHLHSTIRVMDLVRAVQLTPNRFFRLFNLFRNATGLPPGQWRRMHATPFGMRPTRSSKTEVSGSTFLLDEKHFDASARS